MRLRLRKAYMALAALLIPALLFAQSIQGTVRLTLAADYDLDGAAASTTAVHSADQITDSTNYVIDAQPDAPRLLVVTVVDADSSISACTYTVTGTLADGTAATATTSLSGGSGSKTLSPVVNFATVTTAGNGVCTGEGGAADTVALGTSGNPGAVYVKTWGQRLPSSQGYNRLDPYIWFKEPKTIKTSGSSTSITSGVTSSGAFTFVQVQDLITFSIAGEVFERVVMTKSDNNNITVSDPINIVTPVGYEYKHLLEGTEAEDGWLGVQNFSSISFIFNAEQIGNTIHEIVQCRVGGAADPVFTVLDSTVSAAGLATQTIDLSLIGYQACRAGLRFDTNDTDGDAGNELEIISVQFTGVRQ